VVVVVVAVVVIVVVGVVVIVKSLFMKTHVVVNTDVETNEKLPHQPR
jgi:hypothetical protein